QSAPQAWPTLAGSSGHAPSTLVETASGDAALRANVTRYFQEVEAIQIQANDWSGDPQATAMALLKQAASGDPSGFDKMLASQQKLRDQLRQVNVPVPCQEHHSLSERAIDDGIRLLSRTRDAAVSQDQS